MKKKRTIDAGDFPSRSADGHIIEEPGVLEKFSAKQAGILGPILFTFKESAPSCEQHTIFHLINGYEKEAREILKAGRYPLIIKELEPFRWCKERRIRDIVIMLNCFDEVRFHILQNDPEEAALSMAYGVRAAMQAQIRPMEPDILRGRSSIEGASRGGQKKKEVDQARHDQWKLDAGKIKEKHPSFSPWRIAGDLVIFYKNNPKLSAKQDSIWRVIK